MLSTETIYSSLLSPHPPKPREQVTQAENPAQNLDIPEAEGYRILVPENPEWKLLMEPGPMAMAMVVAPCRRCETDVTEMLGLVASTCKFQCLIIYRWQLHLPVD